jgi:L-ascorbate metabolism protein UlaG (beta-lactamase superfamily)
MNTGGKWKFDFGTVKAVNAIHSSGLPDGSYGGNPMGFIIINDEQNFYYSGDTALTLDMQLVPVFAHIDFAILPIGDNFTMGMEDAVQAAKMVQTKRVIGVHYDTFGLIKIDQQKAIDLFKSNGLELMLLAIDETITL